MAAYRVRPAFKDNSFQYIVDIEFQLDAFSDYIKITEQTVEVEIKSKIEKFNKLLHEAEEDDHLLHMDLPDHEVKIFMHQLYYHSLFISLYSFLERKMFQICKIAEEKQNIKIKDLSDEGIVKYRKYIQKVLNINLDSLNSEWMLLMKYNKLRNRLVHFPENMIEKNDSNLSIIKTFESIEDLKLTDRRDFIEYEIADKKLLITFIRTIDKFLHEVYYVKA